MTDRVTVEFTRDVNKGKVVGQVTEADGKSELKNVKSDGTNCPASCSMRAIRGSKQSAILHPGEAGPEVLTMPVLPAGGPISIAADRKSFTLKGADNWAWTYTPTLLQEHETR